MGRTRVKTRKAASSSATEKAAPTIDALWEKAQSILCQCDYPLAQKFALRILNLEPSHHDAKELLGVTQLELGQLDDARYTFQALIPPSPGAPDPPPPSAHLYLAQLSEEDPHEALKHYEAAITLMYGQLKGKEKAQSNGPEETEAEIRKNIVRALIAMVEIWMAPTYDLCFDPEAENNCENLLKRAFETDTDNTEALICLSSLRLSQQRPDEAEEAAMKAWNKWRVSQNEDEEIQLPPIPTRIELTKRFLELHNYNAALSVLQSVMESDDQEVEAWYLQGWCFFLMAESAKEADTKVEELSWEELAQDSLDCLQQCKMLHMAQSHSDFAMLDHTTELLTQLEKLGIHRSNEDEGSEDEWEGINSSDEDVAMD